MEIRIYLEFLSIIIALISMFYLIGIGKIVDHRLIRIAHFITLAYVLFIAGKTIRILNLAGIIENELYAPLFGVFFIIILLLPIRLLYKELKNKFDAINRIERKKDYRNKSGSTILKEINRDIKVLKDKIRTDKIQKEIARLDLKKRKLLSKEERMRRKK